MEKAFTILQTIFRTNYDIFRTVDILLWLFVTHDKFRAHVINS